MKYRRLGKTGLKVSQLGFGAMKLPEGDHKTSTEVLNLALDMGINFIDTARMYSDSEKRIGNAISSRREEFYIVTKTCHYDAKGAREDIDVSLRELKTDKIDLLLLHNIADWPIYEEVIAPGGAYEALLWALDTGRANHLGIAVHMDHDVMRTAIESGLFEAIMLNYGPLNPEDTEAEILPLAKKHDVGVIVMKPVGGGGLVTPGGPPEGSKDKRVEACIRYILANENVSTVIPGMRNTRELKENVDSADKGPLTNEERREFFESLANEGFINDDWYENIKNLYKIKCLQCGYCNPCPQGIDIRTVFRAMNPLNADLFPNIEFRRRQALEIYRSLKVKPDACVECRQCISKCPAKLPIPEMLKEAMETLEALNRGNL